MSNNTEPDFKSVVNGVTAKELKIFDLVKELPGSSAKRAQYVETFFNKCQPVYFRQDKFTLIATIVTDSGQYVASGVARRNPVDEPNDLRGKALALSRAVRHAYNAYVKKPLVEGMEIVVEPETINQAKTKAVL